MRKRKQKQGNDYFKTTLFQIDVDMYLTYFCKQGGVKYDEK